MQHILQFMYFKHNNPRTLGLTDPRSIGPSVYRTLGLTDPRIIHGLTEKGTGKVSLPSIMCIPTRSAGGTLPFMGTFPHNTGQLARVRLYRST